MQETLNLELKNKQNWIGVLALPPAKSVVPIKFFSIAESGPLDSKGTITLASEDYRGDEVKRVQALWSAYISVGPYSNTLL